MEVCFAGRGWSGPDSAELLRPSKVVCALAGQRGTERILHSQVTMQVLLWQGKPGGCEARIEGEERIRSGR